MLQQKHEHGISKPVGRRNSLSRLRDSMPPETLARVDRMARINRGYVVRPIDRILEKQVNAMIEGQLVLERQLNAMREGQLAFQTNQDYAASEAFKYRAIFVIGDSGSGKSTAIKRIFARMPAGLQPYEDDFGQKICPTDSFKAPKPLTMRLLAKTGLESIGYTIDRNRAENEMWDLYRQQLEEREVLWVHIDEMQHAVRGSGHAAMQDIADIAKNLLQLEDWPLCAIFSGVTSLAAFLRFEDTQLRNRCFVLPFLPLKPGGGTKRLKRAVEGVVTVHAEMQTAEVILTDEFVNRLMHATCGAFGTAIQVTREAIFIALRAGREQLLPEDFVQFYATASGCKPDENVFTAPNWQLIDPGKAIHDYIVRFEQEEEAARKARKRG